MATTVSLKPNAVEISGSTSGTTTLQATAVAGTTTLTLPAATDTLVGKATTDTLTNKTLTSPAITGAATFAAGTAAAPAITTTGDTNTGIWFPAADTIAFTEGGVESMRLDSAGNMGLGVTPNANAGQRTLNVANFTGTLNALTMGSNATSAGYIGYNMGNTNSANTWRYMTADTGSALYFAGNEMRFMLFPLGTAGATTSGTQAMTLDASGNLLVGATSSSAIANKSIDVNGTGDAAFVVRVGGTTTSYLYSTAGQTILGTVGALPITFNPNGTERVRIDSSGSLIAGTSSSSGAATPNNYFTLRGGTDTDAGNYTAYIIYSNSTTVFGFRNDGYVRADGVYNKTSGSGANVFVDSSGLLYRSTSSLKYKKDVQDATHGLAKVLALRSVTYKGKNENDGEKIFGGLIAEEVHEAGLTEFVQYAEDGNPDALNYGNMVSLCIKAIQEQQALITQLTARITALEST
jgi:hypothetical protein